MNTNFLNTNSFFQSVTDNEISSIDIENNIEEITNGFNIKKLEILHNDINVFISKKETEISKSLNSKKLLDNLNKISTKGISKTDFLELEQHKLYLQAEVLEDEEIEKNNEKYYRQKFLKLLVFKPKKLLRRYKLTRLHEKIGPVNVDITPDELYEWNNYINSIEVCESFQNACNFFFKYRLKHIYECERQIKCKIDIIKAKNISIEQNHQGKSVEKHTDVFRNNGFILFEYLLNNKVRNIGHGRYADISHFVRRMSENKKYINCSLTYFQEWYCENYKEEISKILTISDDTFAKTKRDEDYTHALAWFKNNNS